MITKAKVKIAARWPAFERFLWLLTIYRITRASGHGRISAAAKGWLSSHGEQVFMRSKRQW